jgi:hypothetical protein
MNVGTDSTMFGEWKAIYRHAVILLKRDFVATFAEAGL